MSSPIHSSRRNFLKLAGCAAGLTAWGFRSASGNESRSPRDLPKRFIIDSHQHYRSDPDYFDILVETYQSHNAMACVNGWRREYAAIAEAAGAFPETVIPYGRINIDEPDAADDVEYFASEGARGIKMHTPLHNWDDESYFPIYEQIESHGMVALFHTGITTVGMPRMRPSYLLTIAERFPDLYIQGAHMGNPWYDEAAEVARLRPKVFFDVTGSTLIKKEGKLEVFKDYLWWPGPTNHSSPVAVYAFEKLLFGSDEHPALPEQGMGLENMLRRYEDLFDACDVPEPSRKKIMGETMANILNVPVRA